MFSGLIFTDTEGLSATLSCTRKEIQTVIGNYINKCEKYIQWQFVDVADSMYDDILDLNDWGTYANILNDYYIGLGFDGMENIPLFIIGGDEIIPMPKIENPIGTVGGEYLYSDMLFGFETDASYIAFVQQSSKYAVGRLPFNEENTLADLITYLEKCVNLQSKGIDVRGAAMTTTESWLSASAEMMRDIPMAKLSPDNVPLSNRMIVSPLLDTSEKDWYDGYVKELKKTDFLVCNLHGSDGKDSKETAYFFGEDKDCDRRLVYYATQPSMLKIHSPLVFNTVACWGARYADYKQDESMLLTAMANGTMIYCGACTTALGGYAGTAGNSELLMKLFCIYLHKGIPAGTAMIKAKQDYYRTCHSEDSDALAMFTILEFNLFCCPLLAMNPKLPDKYEPLLMGMRISNNRHCTYNPVKAVPIGDNAYSADDVLSYIRRRVDDNLSLIREKVEKEVYQRLGLGRDNLQQTFRLTMNDVQIGWRFLYQWTPQTSNRYFQMYYLIDADTNGKIKRIIQTK